ncbi:MAG: SUMF1/EgtB/PvdO family nonheme iron enzyme [Ekhidna sp.]
MKKIFYIVTCLCTGVLFGFERPENVPSKITEIRAKTWYQEISQSWHQYLTENPSDEDGWINYFKASVYAGKGKAELVTIADKAKEYFPDSYTSHYLAFKMEGWSDEGVQHLMSALAINDKSDYTLEDQLILADLINDSERMATSTKVFHAGLIHSSTLNYTYNLLMSVNENGLLVTDALHTTVPIWVLQDVMGIRKDITILNLELAEEQEAYVTKTLAKKNIGSSVNHLLSKENTSEIFYALTLPRRHLQEIESHLYVVGLASTNGHESFNHFEKLKENMEEKFLMDYLTIDFNGEPKTATGNVLSSNYIVPLLLLKDFYDNLNNEERSNQLKQQILELSKDSQIKTRVELLLNGRKTPRTFKVVKLDTKSLDKSMKPIKNKIYASEVELKNSEFWFFMEYLRTNGYTKLYESAYPDISEYDDLTKALLFNYQYSPANATSVKNSRSGNYLDYPVLDITHKTAQAYCEWLTVQYNAQEKRKFRKVLFRLPTKEEWMISALGYKEFTSWRIEENTIQAKELEGKSAYQSYNLSEYQISYPWGRSAWSLRNSIVNNKDCYLANVKVPEDVVCAAGIKGDGYTFVSPVATYFANGFGLYDVIGNVAEMTQNEGEAMGGSWNHEADESTIQSMNEYDGSDISVGFRLFMEVIEE